MTDFKTETEIMRKEHIEALDTTESREEVTSKEITIEEVVVTTAATTIDQEVNIEGTLIEGRVGETITGTTADRGKIHVMNIMDSSRKKTELTSLLIQTKMEVKVTFGKIIKHTEVVVATTEPVSILIEEDRIKAVEVRIATIEAAPTQIMDFKEIMIPDTAGMTKEEVEVEEAGTITKMIEGRDMVKISEMAMISTGEVAVATKAEEMTSEEMTGMKTKLKIILKKLTNNL